MINSINSEAAAKKRLQGHLLVLSFANLLLVSLLGLLLRSFPFLSSFPLEYKNLLHGHSHFAFGGWVMPVLLALVMKQFSSLKEAVAYKHWRNMAFLVLISAYGMLLSFPVQGYKAVSIGFSTVSISATFYLALVVWKAAKKLTQKTSLLFLKWGLLYACLSSLGPFATGPLIVMGKSGTPLYFDVIYFYLHFQYNGFFTFTVLALLYRIMERRGLAANGKNVFLLFNAACFPTYALSVLWSQPSVVFNFVAGAGAFLQVAGVFYLLKDVAASRPGRNVAFLHLSLSAFVLKAVLQLLSAIPAVALLAYQNRNFVIAYLHLVLLGFISLFAFGLVWKENNWSRIGINAFLFSFFTTEILLVLNASSGLLHLEVPYFPQLLLLCSVLFPVSIGCLLRSLKKRNWEAAGKSAAPAFLS